LNSGFKKKKIIIIGPTYPYRGGNALFVTQTYEILKNNFDVKVFNYKLLYPSLLFPGTTQFDKSDKQVFKIPNKRVVNSISPLNWMSVANRIKKENADLIIFDWWHPFFGPALGTISMLIRKKYKNKILFITENVVSHESNKIDKVLTRYGLRNASMFLALSSKVENELTKFGKGRKVYRSELPVYDCYQTGETTEQSKIRKELEISENAIVLLFFGYVRRYKGLDILLEAFPKILDNHPEAFLLIVGEFYDKPDFYLNIIEKNKLKNKVKVINSFVPNEEVSRYYLASDVVVLPYRSATQSGILNVAYGFKKPVIVTDVGGLAEFVKVNKTGIVVKPNSPDELVNGVQKFLELKPYTDFTTNIEEMNKKNSFENLPNIIKEIIKVS